MRVALIVAATPAGVIGRDGGLPWHLPDDLKRFKALTMGKPILMGRRTHESIGRPLPGRRNVVITRRPDYVAEGCTVAHSPDEALVIAAADGADEAFVIGGAEVYRHFLPIADVVHLTTVAADIDGDTTFPIGLLTGPDWIVEHREGHPADARHAFSHRYERLRRVAAPPSGPPAPIRR